MSNKLVNLKDGNDILVPRVFPGVDYDNLITNTKYADTYTAVEDCFIICRNTDGEFKSYSINDVQIVSDKGAGFFLTMLKAGQKIKFSCDIHSSYGANQIIVYGLKY
ncbi:MAG: hypothetical protein KBT03_02145 [Bacteroidales bacterium]|nr:hypothetical protein [Candidatus Scybalousia scybalohippi]